MTLPGWDKAGWTEQLEGLKLELPPVAVSFAIKRPDGIERLEGELGFCQMLKQALGGDVFYTGSKNHNCDGGLAVLGKPVPPVYESGEFGAGLQVFEHYRAMARVYDNLPRLNPERNINYVVFSPLDKVTFQPDLLMLVADVPQAEIVLRAMSFSTGADWTSRYTPVLGCAWLFIYPYLTGKFNYTTAGLGSGMTKRKVVPTGKMILSIPYDLLATTLHGLQTMPWVLPSNLPDGDKFREKLFGDLGLK